MKYTDDEDLAVEIGDVVEVTEEDFEPEEATVVKIGKKKIRVECKNPFIKPRCAWFPPEALVFIAREG